MREGIQYFLSKNQKNYSIITSLKASKITLYTWKNSFPSCGSACSSQSVFIHQDLFNTQLFDKSLQIWLRQMCKTLACDVPYILNVLPNKYPRKESSFIVETNAFVSIAKLRTKSSSLEKWSRKKSEYCYVICRISIKVTRPT